MKASKLEDRIKIRKLSEGGLKDGQIAGELCRSIHTVRKWRRKLTQDSEKGMISRMGRPKKGAMSSFPEAMRDLVLKWRKAHPGWGSKTLRAELGRNELFSGQPLADRATIARYLKQNGLAKRYQKRKELPSKVISPAQACHEEWEMDARGQERIESLGIISLVQVNDVFSRAKLISYPCWLGDQRLTRYPDTEDYQMVLRLAFSEWGLPDRLAVDRAHVFYDAQGKSPFPTRFHLWLLALGVELTFGRPGQPRDQAVTERSHQTWWHQVIEGQTFPDLPALCLALQQRRTFLNENLPCNTLSHLPLLLAHPQARLPKRPYRPECEEEMLDLQRVFAYLGTCQWFRRSSSVGTVSLSKHNYTLGKDWYDCEVEVSFEPSDLCFVFHAPPRIDKRLPIRWISKQSLIGENAPMLLNRPYFQLALPFSWSEWRSLQFCSALSDTTSCDSV